MIDILSKQSGLHINDDLFISEYCNILLLGKGGIIALISIKITIFPVFFLAPSPKMEIIRYKKSSRKIYFVRFIADGS